MPTNKLNKQERIEEILRWTKYFGKAISQNPYKTVVGIDPGRNCLGLSIYIPKADKYVVTHIKSKSYGFTKVIEVKNWVELHLQEKPPLFVFMEDYAYNKRIGRELAGEMGGVLKALFWEMEAYFIPIGVNTLKSAIGSRVKAQIVKEVYKNYGINANNDDEADAFILSKIGECFYKFIKEISETINIHNAPDIELHPEKHCSINYKLAKIVSNLIVNKSKAAYGFKIGKASLIELYKAG